jgi:hypothetical protein
MFGTIRKHQTGLWIIIIALMTVSLLYFFLPGNSGPGLGADGGGSFGTIGGKPVKSKEWYDTMREIELSHYVRSGNWPSGEDAGRARESETLQRLLLIHKLKDLDIHPSDKAVAALMQEQLGDMPLSRFEQEHLARHNLAAGDYTRFLRHEVGIRQLIAAASVSAKFVNAPEAEVIYRKEHQETEVQLALFWGSNYLSKVVITNGAIGSFYTNRMFAYRVPERTIVSYVEFPATNYFAEADKELAGVTNFTEEINQRWSRWDTNDTFLKDDKGLALPEAVAKQKIRDLFRTNHALIAAHRAAAQFGMELYEMKPDPNKAENIEKLAAEKKLTVQVTKPFDGTSGLEEFEAFTNSASRAEESFNFRDTFRRAAFSLSNAAPVQFKPIAGNPVIGPQAVYIMALKGKVEPKMQLLEEISEKVTNDYKLYTAQQLARDAGMAFATNVTNGLTLKKSFEELCKVENVNIVDVPPFSDVTQSLTNFDARINLRQIQYFTRDMEVGKASQFIPFSADGGYVLYVKARPKLDDVRVQAALPDFMGQLRIYRQNEAFQQWFRKQVELTKLSLPARPEDKPGAPK